jgi:hypothetical protein
MSTTPPSGMTFDHKGDPLYLREGYAVGIRSYPSLRAAFDAATKRDHVGYWADTDGQVYYDLVRIVDEEDGARRLGEMYDQIAIWSFRDKCEIRLK